MDGIGGSTRVGLFYSSGPGDLCVNTIESGKGAVLCGLR